MFKTYLGPHKEQSAALEIPDVEETAGVPISLLDSWRFPNKSQRSFRSQLFAAPAARCGSLGNALAEEFLVAWFRKAMHISGLFLIVMRLNNILSYTLVNNLSQEVELDRKKNQYASDMGKEQLQPSFQYYSSFREFCKAFDIVVAPTQAEGRNLSKEVKFFSPGCSGKRMAEPAQNSSP